MTAFELIERLKEYDGDARVCGYNARSRRRNGGFFGVDVALFFDPA